MREDRALGWSPDGEHLVLGRPGRAPTRVLRRPAGAAAQVVIARDGRSAVVLPLRGPIRAFWRIDLSGRARRVSTGAPLDVLRFDASLRHAVGVVRGHHVVRLFELGADSLVGRGRIRTAARVNAYISPNGHWVATARRLRRLPIRYHIGRFGQALVTRPRWHTGATRFLRFAVADDGSALYAVATGRNGPRSRARSTRALAQRFRHTRRLRRTARRDARPRRVHMHRPRPDGRPRPPPSLRHPALRHDPAHPTRRCNRRDGRRREQRSRHRLRSDADGRRTASHLDRRHHAVTTVSRSFAVAALRASPLSFVNAVAASCTRARRLVRHWLRRPSATATRATSRRSGLGSPTPDARCRGSTSWRPRLLRTCPRL